MNAINFDTGLVSYTINGKYELAFNPTDSAFVQKLYAAFDSLDGKQEQYKAETEAASNEPAKVFALAEKRDAEMRENVDGVLGAGASDVIFEGMNLYALANGLPVWANLFLAIMDEIDTGFAKEQKATNPRIAKYQSRYGKR